MAAKQTLDQFVSRANIVHDNKYTYEFVEYKNIYTKVKISCRLHGVFEQQPNSHLNGAGCPICALEKKQEQGKNKTAKAKSEFVSKARSMHGDKYTYELVDYKNNRTKVKIICREHGEFEQEPRNHLAGNGCAKCAIAEKGWTRTNFKANCIKNNNGLGILYVLECFNDHEHFIKIGITSNSIKQRYDSKAKMPYNYRVIDEIVGDPEYIFNLETKMHQQHKEHQYEPKLYFYGSSTECFKQYITKT